MNHVTKGELCASIGSAPLCDQYDIFSLPPASRRDDPLTSKIAGNKFATRRKDGKLSKLQEQVLAAFRVNGAMTDETLENLPCFKFRQPRPLAHTTVRCRRGELYKLGLVVEYGLMTNSNGSPMTIWAIKEGS